MERYRFAGYRIVEFADEVTERLTEVAHTLLPHQDDILNNWMTLQWKAWQPPGFSYDDLRKVFGDLMTGLLECLAAGEPERCITALEDTGADLARRQFPFEALIISVHFFEESYMPRLVSGTPQQVRERLVCMDEFLHAALAAISTSYFHEYRAELFDRAEVGRIVQEGLLTDIPKRIADLEVAHIYISARERAQIGGDFLDHFRYGDSEAFLIGDLSGHGLEAAADSVMIRSLYKGFVREKPDLTDAMARLNRVLAEELEPGHFATALAMSYDGAGDIGLVGAGHPYPILCDSSGCRLLRVYGTALAISSDSAYNVAHVHLEPGATLIAYTDGLMEARTRGKPVFGEESIVAAAEEFRNASPRGIIEHLVDASLRYAGGRFLDDVAILVIKRQG